MRHSRTKRPTARSSLAVQSLRKHTRWLEIQPTGTQALIRCYLAEPVYCKAHADFLDVLAPTGIIVGSLEYMALLELWQIPSKKLFHLAVHQTLSLSQINGLFFAAEMGLARHGAFQLGRGEPKYYYSDSIAELQERFPLYSPLEEVLRWLQNCQVEHEALERTTWYGDTIPGDVWAWYCQQPVEVQEYLRRTACFADDDLVGNGDDFWQYGPHNGLHAWLLQCVATGRNWNTGLELHTAFVTEAPRRTIRRPTVEELAARAAYLDNRSSRHRVEIGGAA